MADRATRKLGWLADTLHVDSLVDPIPSVLAAIPALQPGTAAVVARHLADEDRWIREAIDLAPAREPVPGAPECGVRRLEVQTAGPIDAWTVVCAVGCRSRGEGCPCGMPGAVEGAAHIWPRTDVLAPTSIGA
ncbi:hypothetical protein ABZ793_23610 [Micromonospora sp. NPDC047465]|uniref:hypothetical protein n=1 Tax=Micromonospora sp. NPDC047465 TaxID=3154813 RepID=UPI00340A4DC2